MSAGAAIFAKWGGRRTQRHSRGVFAEADDQEGKDDSANLLQHVAQLEKQLERVTKGNKGARRSSSRKAGSTPCPRKNCTPVYVAITLADVGF